MTRLQVWDYGREYESLRSEILAAVDEVFLSGRLILGEKVKKFEHAFATYLGLRRPGVGVGNGTDALFLALKALGIGPGDEVITVANTAVPTVSSIVSTGALPRFVDIDPTTYLMDCNDLDDAITDRTACILPVHLFGQCADMGTICAIAHQHDLSVLEDCAQSAGATQHGRPSGTFGNIAAFSFYPTKLLGAYGDGGMIVTDSDELVRKCRRLRMYGMESSYYAEEHGYNSRLDEVQAAILLVKLARLDAWIGRRRAIADRYRQRLEKTALTLPVEAPNNRHGFYVYVVRHPERDRIVAALAESDIHINVSYPVPVSLMSAYAHFGYRQGSLPATELAAQEIFSLPMYPELTDDEQDRVCDVLVRIAG